MKRILLSHIDLDGVGSPIIVKLYFTNYFDNIIMRDYGWEEDKETIELLSLYDEIIITDLSAPEEFVDSLVKQGKEVKVFDHHIHAEWLKNKSYGVYDENRCGTKIFWEEWAKPRLSRYYPITDYFVELVDVYDRWQQKNILWEEAKNLNSVLYNKTTDWNEPDSCIKFRPFIDRIVNKIRKSSEWKWTMVEEGWIQDAIKKENDTLDKALSTMKIRYDYKGKKFAIIAIGSKISLTCSKILDIKPDLDYIICLNLFRGLNGKLSVRTTRENFDLNELSCCAGHAQAAGGQMIPEIVEEFWNDERYCFAYKDYPEYNPDRQRTWLINTYDYI